MKHLLYKIMGVLDTTNKLLHGYKGGETYQLFSEVSGHQCNRVASQDVDNRVVAKMWTLHCRTQVRTGPGWTLHCRTQVRTPPPIPYMGLHCYTATEHSFHKRGHISAFP